MKDYQRKQLLERIDREGATVGTRIPERVTVLDEPVDLREFVFEVKRLEAVPPGDQNRVDRAKRNLRRERLDRRRRLEEGDLEFEAAEALAESVIGIDRALNALERLDSPGIEAEAAEREGADRKRWMGFLRQVLGHDDRTGRSRP